MKVKAPRGRWKGKQNRKGSIYSHVTSVPIYENELNAELPALFIDDVERLNPAQQYQQAIGDLSGYRTHPEKRRHDG